MVVVGYAHDYTTSKYLGRMWINGVEKVLPVGNNGESKPMAAAFIGDQPAAVGYYPMHTGPNNWYHEAMIWHNGEIEQSLPLPTGAPVHSQQAVAIHVTTKDVHVVGGRVHAMDSQFYHPLYWKNGIEQFLKEDKDWDEKEYDTPTGVAVTDEGVVYISGVDYRSSFFPVYWRNGVLTELGSLWGWTTGVATRGYDVYISGYVYATANRAAVVWKNGTMQRLSDGITPAIARAVATGGYDDVYVVGATDSNSTTVQIAKLWKNGVEQPLEGATAGSDAVAVKVVGNDVYVAGTVLLSDGQTVRRAALWVNGKLQILPSAIDNLSKVYVTGLAVR